jgi:hypothetical protein
MEAGTVTQSTGSSNRPEGEEDENRIRRWKIRRKESFNYVCWRNEAWKVLKSRGQEIWVKAVVKYLRPYSDIFLERLSLFQ